jgi:hypothetical protein
LSLTELFVCIATSLKSSVSSNSGGSTNPAGLPLVNDTVSFAGRGDRSSSSYPYAYASAPCPLVLAAAVFTWLCVASHHRLRL